MPLFSLPDRDEAESWRNLIPQAFDELIGLVKSATCAAVWDEVEENLALWSRQLPYVLRPEKENDGSRRLQRLTELCWLARRACEPDAQLREQFGSPWKRDAYRQLRGEPLDLLPGAPVSVPIVVAEEEQLTGRVLSLQVTLLTSKEAAGTEGRVYPDPEQWYLVLDGTFRDALTGAWELVIDETARDLPDADSETLRRAACRFRLTSMDRTPTHEVPLIGGPSAQAAFAVAAYTACRRAVGLPVLDLDGRMIVSATVKKQEDTVSLGPVEFLDAKLAAIRRADLPGGGRIVVAKALSEKETEEIDAAKDRARDRCRTEGMKGIPDVVQIGTFRELHERLTDRATLTRLYLEALREAANATHWKRPGREGTIRAQDIAIPLKLLILGGPPASDDYDDYHNYYDYCRRNYDNFYEDYDDEESSIGDETERFMHPSEIYGELVSAKPPSISLVTGRAGAGKSFLAKQIVFDQAEEALEDSPGTSSSAVHLLPVFLPAVALMDRDFPRYDFEPGKLADFVAKRAIRSIGLSPGAKEAVHGLLCAELAHPQGQVFLIIDALDETGAAAVGELKQRLQSLIENLQHAMVLTCREEQSRDFRRIGLAIPTHYEILPVSDSAPDDAPDRSAADSLKPQADAADSERTKNASERRLDSVFISNWFRDAPGIGESLVRRLRKNGSLQSLADLPLGLTLLCLCHERNEVGAQARLGDIYEAVLLSWLSTEWHADSSRDSDAAEGDLDNLAAVVVWLFERTPDIPSFSRRDFVEAFLATKWGNSKMEAEETLERLSHRGAGALQLDGDRYSLAHARFRDYLVAHTWCLQAKQAPEMWSDLLATLDSHAWLPAWQAPIVCLSGMLPDTQRQELIATLENPTRDDLLRNRGWLAYNCEVAPDSLPGPERENREHWSMAWGRRHMPMRSAWEDAANWAAEVLHPGFVDEETDRLEELCRKLRIEIRVRSHSSPLPFSGVLAGDVCREAVAYGGNALRSSNPDELSGGLYVLCNLGSFLSEETDHLEEQMHRHIPLLRPREDLAVEHAALLPATDALAEMLIEHGMPALQLFEERRHRDEMAEDMEDRQVAHQAEWALVLALSTAAALCSASVQEEVAHAVGEIVFAPLNPLRLGPVPAEEWDPPWRECNKETPAMILACGEVAAVWIEAMLPYLGKEDEPPSVGAFLERITHGDSGASLVEALANGVRRPDIGRALHARRLYQLGEFACALHDRKDTGSLDTSRVLSLLDSAGFRFFPGTGQVGDIRTGRLTPPQPVELPPMPGERW
jgi:hypothetical protein